MFDFRLKVFHTVATRLNFTRAAEELHITQPAVTKHIHEIESFYKTKLFERNGSKIKLTPAGTLLLKHTEELFNIYRKIDFDLSSANEQLKGTLRLGASTTVAQYILPAYLASFRQKFPDIHIDLTTHNTEHIERLLADNKIDLGITEGQSKRQHLRYTPFLKDEIVLCTRSLKKNTISLKELPKLPLVIREPGSGSLEVIVSALKKEQIKLSQLQVEFVLSSIESIKTYLLNSSSFAFLSIHSILKELKNKELQIVDIRDFSIERMFYFITQQGNNGRLEASLMKFMTTSDNLKL